MCVIAYNQILPHFEKALLGRTAATFRQIVEGTPSQAKSPLPWNLPPWNKSPLGVPYPRFQTSHTHLKRVSRGGGLPGRCPRIHFSTAIPDQFRPVLQPVLHGIRRVAFLMNILGPALRGLLGLACPLLNMGLLL